MRYQACKSHSTHQFQLLTFCAFGVNGISGINGLDLIKLFFSLGKRRDGTDILSTNLHDEINCSIL